MTRFRSWMLGGAVAVVLASSAPTVLAAGGPDRRLVDAAKDENWPLVQGLLKQGPGGSLVNTAQPDGSTALHWAVYHDRSDVVDALIRAGAKVNAANELGATPLWLAAVEGRAAMLDRLLRGGADAKTALTNGETPLMSAARAGNLEAVKLLVARGADVNAKESGRGQTALMWAVDERHAEVTRVLVEAGADVGARTQVRKMLVNHGIDGLRRLTGDLNDLYEEGQGGFTPLLFAARNGDLSSARLLIAAGANVNDTTPGGATPLVIAAFSGQSELAQQLLEAGANPNAADAGYAALHLAILRGDLPLTKKLLAKGADPNAAITRSTPFRRNSQDWAIHPSWVGVTPLWLAAKFSDVEFMRTLAASGADATFVRKDGTTILMATLADGPDRRIPLLFAPDRRQVERKVVEAIGVASELGVKVDGANANGDTALHAAVARQFTSVIETLVAKGAPLEAKNKKGLTPLALAASLPPPRPSDPAAGQPPPATNPTVEMLKKLGATQ